MENLDYYRKRIDIIDKKIVSLLVSRINISKKISVYKRKHKIKIADAARERHVLNNIKNRQSKRNEKFLKKLFRDIINYSKCIQKN